MAYRGHVHNNTVVLEPGVSLPEGMEVLIEPIARPTRAEGGNSLSSRLGDLIGSAQGLPEDLAANYDHYIDGATKR